MGTVEIENFIKRENSLFGPVCRVQYLFPGLLPDPDFAAL